MEATTQYFGKWFFFKQVLEFHCPSKFLCQTSGRQNHWSLLVLITSLATVMSIMYPLCENSDKIPEGRTSST